MAASSFPETPQQAALDGRLQAAVREGDPSALTEALIQGANPNNETYAPLCWAAGYGNLQVVRLLLEAGADPQQTDANGSNPLIYAISNDQPAMLDFLLQRFPDYPLQTAHVSAMMQTVNRDYKEDMLTRLLDAGADPHTPCPHDSRNFSCFDIASERGWSDALYLMNQYARADLPSVDNVTHAAIAEPANALLQHPQGWKQFAALTARLEEKGTPLCKADLTREFADSRSYMRRAVECYRLKDALEYLNGRGEQLTADDLLTPQGKPNALLFTCIDRQALASLFTPENWRGQASQELSKVWNAIPANERGQVSNYHALQAQLRQQQSHQGGKGR
jgi:hypothetical protein